MSTQLVNIKRIVSDKSTRYYYHNDIIGVWQRMSRQAYDDYFNSYFYMASNMHTQEVKHDIWAHFTTFTRTN
jgi:hypothetical protein